MLAAAVGRLVSPPPSTGTRRWHGARKAAAGLCGQAAPVGELQDDSAYDRATHVLVSATGRTDDLRPSVWRRVALPRGGLEVVRRAGGPTCLSR